MHVYLVHANIMVNVIPSRKDFNANAMEAMEDRSAPVCIVLFHPFHRNTRICKFGICFTFYRNMHVRMNTHLHLYVKIIIGECYMRDDCFIRIAGK